MEKATDNRPRCLAEDAKREWEAIVRRQVDAMQYGVVQIVVHEGARGAGGENGKISFAV